MMSALLKIGFFFHQESKKKELIKNLDALYGQLQREHQISPGDFPDIKKMQEVLQHQDFAKFKALDKRLLDRVWKLISFAFENLKLVGKLMENLVSAFRWTKCWRRTSPS